MSTQKTETPLSLAELEELEDSTAGLSLEELEDDKKSEEDAPPKVVKVTKEKGSESKSEEDEEDEEDEKDKEDDEKEEEEEESEDDKDESGEEDTDDPSEYEAFYAEVDKQRGEVIVVDYGDVDPMSPEGVYIREKAIEDYGADKFEKILEEKYPEAYDFFLHLATGKPKEDFFKASADIELPTLAELRVDENKQDEIILLHLQNKGLSKEKAVRYLNALDDAEKIAEAEEALSKEQEAEDKKRSKAKADFEAKMAQQQEDISTFVAKIDDAVISKGKLGKMTIPVKERKAFADYLKSNVSYVDGKFVIATEVDDAKLLDVMQQQFFAFKRGDLSDLVQEKANTVNTVRGKFTMKKSKELKSKTSSGERGPTLGEL